MKVAIIGQPGAADRAEEMLLRALPPATTELLCAESTAMIERIAHTLRIPLRPVAGNVVDSADEVLIFWDGTPGPGSRLAADCVKRGKPVRLLPVKKDML